MLLVLQVVCDRVIYFTDDPDYLPPQTDYTWVARYEKPLPEGFSLKNCWSWRLQAGTLIDASGIPPERAWLTQEAATLNANKQTLVTLLRTKLDSLTKLLSTTTSQAAIANVIALELMQGKHSPTATLAATAAELSYEEFMLEFQALNSHRVELLAKAEGLRLRYERMISKATIASELEVIRRQVNTLSL